MQSRGFTRGDVPPVDGESSTPAQTAKRIRTAWLLWGAFMITLAQFYFVGWKIMPPGALETHRRCRLQHACGSSRFLLGG